MTRYKPVLQKYSNIKIRNEIINKENKPLTIENFKNRKSKRYTKYINQVNQCNIEFENEWMGVL